MPENEKVRENRLRRMALRRKRLKLEKSRLRDPQALGYGRYWLVSPRTSVRVAGGELGMTLDEIEAYLDDPDSPGADPADAKWVGSDA